MKKITTAAILLAASAVALSGCATPPPDDDSTSTPTGAQQSDFLACMISDAGGFDDKSFNQSGFEGLKQAETELGIQITQSESKNVSDYVPNLNSMYAQGCDITVTVGFALQDATEAQALKYPDTKFAIVDNDAIDLPNVRSLVFKTSDASFLAGYVAAGYSKTGTVATFGGSPFPTVTIFMDGFVDGVAKYNEDFGKDVKVLGWDKAAQTGSFTGDFEDQSKGQNLAETFISQGADVIMPVAGPVGLGAANAADANGNVAIVWVDADGYNTTTQYQSLFLTSVVKEIQVSVFDTISQTVDGNFPTAPFVGTLENGGVGIAPYHDFESKIPQEVKDKVEELKQQIIAGTLKVTSPSDPKVS